MTIRERKLAAKLNNCKARYRLLLKESISIQRNAQSFAHLLFLQQEEDRKEISRELHDEIAQILTGINFELAILSKEASTGTRVMREKIIKTQRLVEQSVETIHRFARELRPMVLDDLGLLPALKSQISDFSKSTQIPVSLTCKSKLSSMGDFSKTVLFRVAQEALQNIAKHSRASKVWISLKRRGTMMQVQIKDNGRAFNVNRLRLIGKSRRIGLLGMRERVKLAGGTISILSSKGSGTTITAQVPVCETKV